MCSLWVQRRIPAQCTEKLLLIVLAGTRLRLELDRIPLWRGDHVSTAQLSEDFARYSYLPRLREPSVLYKAGQDSATLLMWAQEWFAYADSYDETEGRYCGLRGGVLISTIEGGTTEFLVRADVAASIMASRRLASLVVEPASPSVPPGARVPFVTKGFDQQGLEVEVPSVARKAEGGAIGRDGVFVAGEAEGAFEIEALAGLLTAHAAVSISKKALVTSPLPVKLITGPKCFRGSVALAPSRVGRDAGQIAEEVVAHLGGLVGSEVKVTLEIVWSIPSGAPENVVRTVTENCRTLKLTSHGFEED